MKQRNKGCQRKRSQQAVGLTNPHLTISKLSFIRVALRLPSLLRIQASPFFFLWRCYPSLWRSQCPKLPPVCPWWVRRRQRAENAKSREMCRWKAKHALFAPNSNNARFSAFKRKFSSPAWPQAVGILILISPWFLLTMRTITNRRHPCLSILTCRTKCINSG